LPNLWQVLGYDEVVAKIAATLHKGPGLCVLEGPPGVGKSWLANDIGTLWEGDKGKTVLAEGDRLNSDRFLYPFNAAMGGLPREWRAIRPAVASAVRTAETLLVGTGGLFTTTVEAAAAVQKSRRGRRAKYVLEENEQAALARMERLARKRPLLFIADNLHWWDAKSLNFLARLNDPKMWDGFPFLRELRILAVQTPEPYQSVLNRDARDVLLAASVAPPFLLEHIQRQNFENVLMALAEIPRPADKVTDDIYKLSGGNLVFAKRCADRLVDGDTELISAASDAEAFLRKLLVDRIQSLGDLGKQAVSLLQVAAVLGLRFRRDEASCASGVEDGEDLRLLRHCHAEGVLEEVDGLDQFVHDLYHQHFLDLRPEGKREIHEGLTGCLRKLSPGDYKRRCLNALEAEDHDEAAALAVHAALQNVREGRPWDELPPRVAQALRHGEMESAVELLVEARGHLRRYEAESCCHALDSLPHRLPNSLKAEAIHIRAMCLMSTRSEADREEGRETLRQWRGYENEEPELGFRLMQLLLYGLTHQVDKSEGRELHERLQQRLTERMEYDRSAEDLLYSLDRCSAGLYPPNISIKRKYRAVRYYGPHGNQSTLRRPVEYYRCLVNYCGSLISNSSYEKAREVHGEIGTLVGEYSSDTFPRLDFAHMNGLLADYRLKLINPAEAARRQRKIVSSLEAASDPFYPENALGCYLGLAGELGESIDIFDRLWDQLTGNRTDPEPSVMYMIGANRSVARFLAGDTERAEEEWTGLDDIVTRIAYTFRPILIQRHRLLAEVMRDGRGSAMSPPVFDECLLGRNAEARPELWENLGRAFRIPGVEIWREN
jgi:AAA ATPase domain